MTRRGAGRQFGVVGRRRFGARHESGALGRIRACVREVVSPEGVTARRAVFNRFQAFPEVYLKTKG